MKKKYYIFTSLHDKIPEPVLNWCR